MEEELSREEVVSIFKESWKELIEEYGKSRALSTFCSEADVELHLAHKLLNKLSAEIIHIEFPIPLNIERLNNELWAWGRVGMRKCIKTDITVIDPVDAYLYLMRARLFAIFIHQNNSRARQVELSQDYANELRPHPSRSSTDILFLYAIPFFSGYC